MSDVTEMKRSRRRNSRGKHTRTTEMGYALARYMNEHDGECPKMSELAVMLGLAPSSHPVIVETAKKLTRYGWLKPRALGTRGTLKFTEAGARRFGFVAGIPKEPTLPFEGQPEGGGAAVAIEQRKPSDPPMEPVKDLGPLPPSLAPDAPLPSELTITAALARKLVADACRRAIDEHGNSAKGVCWDVSTNFGKALRELAGE